MVEHSVHSRECCPKAPGLALLEARGSWSRRRNGYCHRACCRRTSFSRRQLALIILSQAEGGQTVVYAKGISDEMPEDILAMVYDLEKLVGVEWWDGRRLVNCKSKFGQGIA